MKAFLGDFVVTGKYKYRGRVVEIHIEGCPENKMWQSGQEIPLSKDELKEVWYSILVHGGGCVTVAESDIVKKEKPYKFDNLYASNYFEEE